MSHKAEGLAKLDARYSFKRAESKKIDPSKCQETFARLATKHPS